MAEGVRRRHILKEDELKKVSDDEEEQTCEIESDHDDKNLKLNLMEEVLLIGLKDREGYTSFWNDKISSGLRACILIELAIRDRIKFSEHSRYGCQRTVCVKSDAATGDQLLDEALRTIKSSLKGCTVSEIIDYLSGESWNVLMLSAQMRNVRERVAKGLVDRGILTTEKQNFIFFDMTTHPLSNVSAKQELVRKVQNALLSQWQSSFDRMDKRTLALVMMCHFSDVLEEALTTLSQDDYTAAMNRVESITGADMYALAAKDTKYDLMWAVFIALSK